jgi:hypothetical protein
MNQGQRFDELTRALATTQLSRWQVLKGLVAGAVVAGTFGGWARSAVAARPRDSAECGPRAASQCEFDSSEFRKTCLKGCKGEPGGKAGCTASCFVQAEDLRQRCLLQVAECPAACEQRCVDGRCVNCAASGSRTTCCSGVCFDLSVDESNCGSCGIGCAATATCENGKCECHMSCPAPLVPNPHRNCECECQANVTCSPPRAPTPNNNCKCECPSSLTDCGGSCVDILTNAQHCGGCDQPCPAGRDCANGQCQPTVCNPPCDRCKTCEPVPDPIAGTKFECVGKEPCGDSGECCAPGECDLSTGQCSSCVPPCSQCETCIEGVGVCVPDVFCEGRQVVNPDSCECECPPQEEECVSPKTFHPTLCSCECPPRPPQGCTPPRTVYDSETCECYCPQEPADYEPDEFHPVYEGGVTGTQPCGDNECCVRCNGSICAPGQICCGHGGLPELVPHPFGEVCCSFIDCCNEAAGHPGLCCPGARTGGPPCEVCRWGTG